VKITLCSWEPSESTIFPSYLNWVPTASGNSGFLTSSGLENGPPAGWAALPMGAGLADADGAPLEAAGAVDAVGVPLETVGAADEPLLAHPASRPQASSAAPPGTVVVSSPRTHQALLGRCGMIMWILRFLAAAAASPGGARGDRTSGTATGR
jgi:hypothetical protein